MPLSLVLVISTLSVPRHSPTHTIVSYPRSMNSARCHTPGDSSSLLGDVPLPAVAKTSFRVPSGGTTFAGDGMLLDNVFWLGRKVSLAPPFSPARKSRSARPHASAPSKPADPSQSGAPA